MADDHFGFLDSGVPKSLTPPEGYEAVHRDGNSWARQGDRLSNTSWIDVAQWNHIIAQFRGLATVEGVDVDDLLPSSPLLLRDFILRAIFAVLTNELPGFGVMDKATYDADNDGIVDLAHGGTGLAASSVADLRTKLGAAPLASPALTGTPTAPTQALGNNSTRLATTAFVQAAVAALVASSPAALDTLNELAAALGNDPNFATTMTNALAAKAPLASPALTGNPTAPTQALGNNSTRLATTAFVQAAIAALVASSPAALDTLNELAAALGNDPNFATTMTNALAAKAPTANPVFTGAPVAPTQAVGNNSTRIATTAFVQAAVGSANAGGAKAWVNFDGTGTVAIRGSLNVSSITDNGTGDYTINFATALANANYAVAGMTTGATANSSTRQAVLHGTTTGGATLKSTTGVRVITGATHTNSMEDMADVSIVIVGG